MDIGCRINASGYGGNTGDDACPMDPGAYHAGGTTCPEGQKDCQLGWSENTEDNLMGCAIAIAYKPTAAETNPEDFTVMSIQPSCVRKRLTSFELPENLPACPEGGCTCAWFWSGYNSDNEMYMTGFRCDVEGGVITDDYPVSKEPLKGTLQDGPVQPFYWATTLNNIGYTLANGDLDKKPKYNEDYGWKAGAQTHAFAGVAAGGATSQNVADPVANAVVPPVESGSAPDAEAIIPTATMDSEPEATSEVAEGPAGPGAMTETAAGSPDATDALPTAPAAFPTGLDEDAAAPGPGAESMSKDEYGSGSITADAGMPEATADGEIPAVAMPTVADDAAAPSLPAGNPEYQSDPASPAPTGYAPPKDADAGSNPAGDSKPDCTMGGGRGGRGGHGGRHSRTGGRWRPDQAQQTGALAGGETETEDQPQPEQTGEAQTEYEKRAGKHVERRSRWRPAH